MLKRLKTEWACNALWNRRLEVRWACAASQPALLPAAFTCGGGIKMRLGQPIKPASNRVTLSQSKSQRFFSIATLMQQACRAGLSMGGGSLNLNPNPNRFDRQKIRPFRAFSRLIRPFRTILKHFFITNL
jgi:hypothetical protein